MQALLQNSEIIVYFICLVLFYIGLSITLLNPQSGYNGHWINYRFYIQRVKNEFSDFARDDASERIFREAGYPLLINGFRFQLFRLFIIFILLIEIVVQLFYHNFTQGVWLAMYIVAWLLVTNPKKGYPLEMLLSRVRNRTIAQKNRECFVLYAMLLNEFSLTDSNQNLYSVLRRINVYFDTIRLPIYQCLAVWTKGPDYALNVFAEGVGTQEARDLAKILKTVEESGTPEIVDLLRNRYEYFQVNRHENHRRTLKSRDLIGYILVFVPILAILFNMVFVFGLAVEGLLTRVSH